LSKAAIFSWVVLGSLAAGSGQMFAQSMLHQEGPSDAPVNLVGNDAAILDSGEAKKDLPCTVTPVKPILGFDLRFHSGYDITIPLKELSGNGDTLTIVFRVKSGTANTSPVYFSHKYNVPEIDADAAGNAYLGGSFDIGEGDYHVDWLMRDRIERVCSSSWDITAALTGRDQSVKLPIERDHIEASDVEFFRDEPAVTRVNPESGPDSGPDAVRKAPLKVKVLINFAPQQGNASSMQPIDISALVSILRNIAREPRIRKFSLVAFNMNEQRVVYRNDSADQIDFPKLGKALATLKFGMIDYKKLADPHSGSDFLAKLVMDELPNSNADAVIFVGPKVMLTDNVPPDNLKDLANVSVPVYYMNYNLFPVQNPWRDPIGNVVKRLRGAEYTIARPRDLWTSWSDIMSRIVKLKLVTVEATSSH
jgi:hypothetical protein